MGLFIKFFKHASMIADCLGKGLENWVRAVEAREKFGVELGAHHEGMVGIFHNFNQAPVR